MEARANRKKPLSRAASCRICMIDLLKNINSLVNGGIGSCFNNIRQEMWSTTRTTLLRRLYQIPSVTFTITACACPIPNPAITTHKATIQPLDFRFLAGESSSSSFHPSSRHETRQQQNIPIFQWVMVVRN